MKILPKLLFFTEITSNPNFTFWMSLVRINSTSYSNVVCLLCHEVVIIRYVLQRYLQTYVQIHQFLSVICSIGKTMATSLSLYSPSTREILTDCLKAKCHQYTFVVEDFQFLQDGRIKVVVSPFYYKHLEILNKMEEQTLQPSLQNNKASCSRRGNWLISYCVS